MTPPTQDKWFSILDQLPNDKVYGPSQIPNEFYKHVGPSIRSLTWFLAQHYFTLGFIPDDWKLAYIFLIPKSMMWDCDITKTRPITLLDTLRKATMKVLTNHLSRILVKHSVLKG